MTIELQVQGAINEFVAKLTSLARQAAIETLTELLAPRVRSEQPRSRAQPDEDRGADGARRRREPAARRRRPGPRRPAEHIARLESRLAQHIAKHPGQHVAQINKALGTVTRDVRRPISKLVSAGTVTTKGTRRATTYFSA